MKWFKLILDVTIFILIAILLFVYTYKENEEILPDTKYPIAVTDWNKKYSKNENVAIYKSTSNYTNKNVDKDIYIYMYLINQKQQLSLLLMLNITFII